LSHKDDENINMIHDSMRQSKVIVKKFSMKPYKRTEEAQIKNLSASFTLNEIITAAFSADERETVRNYFQRFPDFFQAGCIIREDSENVKRFVFGVVELFSDALLLDRSRDVSCFFKESGSTTDESDWLLSQLEMEPD
jgi:hypothetical protein